MTERATQRAGWYTDPLGQADLRWWDSRGWTTQVTNSHAKEPRLTTAPRAATLQWADDEHVEAAPAGGTRTTPPAEQPAAEPQLALGSNASPRPEPATPDAPDWSALALALLGAGDDIVTATSPSMATMTIDMAERTFWWASSLDSLVGHPADLVVTTVARREAVKPAVAGRYIEPLLWRLGTGAGTLFTNVDATLRYKLRRWPDLAAMPHSADQLRAITLLANAQLTTTEISTIAGLSETDVRTLIGTFTLMELLDAVKDPAATR
jgi:hypothetical protein